MSIRHVYYWRGKKHVVKWSFGWKTWQLTTTGGYLIK
jgi:hypothetical protein